jgi:GAF domain-containing protein
VRQYDGELLRIAAHYNVDRRTLAGLSSIPARPGPESAVGRAFAERRPVHLPDVLLDPGYAGPARQTGARTVLAVPLLREGTPIGTISIFREAVQPFTDQQVAVLGTFADQAVIAIENVRLFQELEARNRELTESLEQQTATAEILGVISRSPTDLQPVLKAVVKSASRLCGAANVSLYRVEGDLMRKVADQGVSLTTLRVDETRPITRTTVSGRTIVDRSTCPTTSLRKWHESTQTCGAIRASGPRSAFRSSGKGSPSAPSPRIAPRLGRSPSVRPRCSRRLRIRR